MGWPSSPWTVLLVVLLPGPIITLLQCGAEVAQKRLQSEVLTTRAEATTEATDASEVRVVHPDESRGSLHEGTVDLGP